MNFQQMDSLGGLIAGNKARMDEDSIMINQQNVLEQIASAAQKRDFEAQMQPLNVQGADLLNKDRQSMIESRNVGTDNARAQENRRKTAEYVGAVIQYGNLPGADDALADQFGIPANHPVRRAVKEAQVASQNWQGPPEQSPINVLQQKLAMQDDKSRQATATADAQIRKQESINDTRLQQERMRQDGANLRNQLDNETKQLVAEARAATASGKIPNAQQILGQSMARVQEVMRMPEGPEKNAALLKAQQELQLVTTSMGNINSARTWAQAEAEATRLKQLVPNLQIDPKAFQQGGPAAPAAPAAAPAGPKGGTTKSGVKYTVTGGAAPAPAAPAAAPAGSSGAPNWWDDPNG